MQAQRHAALTECISFLRIDSLTCRLLFDREVLLLPSGASACARGVAGHLLTAQVPELTRRFFKPGQGGDAPAAFVLQPGHFSPVRGREFAFRVFCWERSGEFLNGLMSAFASSAGRPWGDTGAVIAGFEASPPEMLAFEGSATKSARSLRARLLTPLVLKAHVREREPGGEPPPRSRKRLLNPPEITLGRLCQALVARVNNVSLHYGNGEALNPEPFLAKAALVRETGRNLELVRARRHSSAQQKAIYLDGVTGWLDFAAVPPPLHDLLALGSVFHLGQRTADGCGWLTLEDGADNGLQ